MKLIRLSLFLLLILLAVFHITTCSYVKCESGVEAHICDVRQHSGQLHNSNTHLSGKVVSTFSIPGFRVYYLSDGTGSPMMVKVPIGSAVPPSGASLSVCAVVHEIINLNDQLKIVILEELDRSENAVRVSATE